MSADRNVVRCGIRLIIHGMIAFHRLKVPTIARLKPSVRL
jgi:hypothetical protein